MVSKNLILQKNDDLYSLSEYKTASEGSLHPRPEGQGIRDPLRSHSNKNSLLKISCRLKNKNEVLKIPPGGSEILPVLSGCAGCG